MRGVLVREPRDVDLGLGEAEVLVDAVPLVVDLALLALRLVDLGGVGGRVLLALRERRLHLLLARGVHLARRLLDLVLGALRLQAGELGLVLLPGPVVVRPDHERHHDQQADRGEREHHVQFAGTADHLRVAAGFVLSHGRASRTPRGRSYVEEDLGQRHDVLQVERPAQDHLDRQRDHGEQQEHEHSVAPRAHLVVVLLEPDRHAQDLVAEGQQAGQHADVEEHQQDARQLAQQHVARQAQVRSTSRR